MSPLLQWLPHTNYANSSLEGIGTHSEGGEYLGLDIASIQYQSGAATEQIMGGLAVGDIWDGIPSLCLSGSSFDVIAPRPTSGSSGPIHPPNINTELFNNSNCTPQDSNTSTGSNYPVPPTAISNTYHSGSTDFGITRFNVNDNGSPRTFYTGCYSEPSVASCNGDSYNYIGFPNFSIVGLNNGNGTSLSSYEPLPPTVPSSASHPLRPVPRLKSHRRKDSQLALSPDLYGQLADGNESTQQWPSSVRSLPIQKPYVCEISNCREQFTTLHGRSTHARNTHKRLFFCNCPGCPRMNDYTVFETRQSLDEHWLSEHQAVKHFRCCECWYSTDNVTNMKEKHFMKVHCQEDVSHAMEKIKEEKKKRNTW